MSRLAQLAVIATSIAAMLVAATVQHLVVLQTTITASRLVVPVLAGVGFGSLIVAVLRARAALEASTELLNRQRSEIAQLNQRLSGVVRNQGAELKSAELRLVEAHRLSNVGLLASGVAHDFNNLLTVVLAGSTWLLPEAEGERREVLESILSASERGAALTRQLLTLARPAQPASAAEVHCLNRALTQLEPLLVRLAGRETRLVVGRCQGELPVPLPLATLEQLLLNLVVNARDAMPGGGRLHLETTRAHNGCQLRVTDQGVGMPPEVRARIFEPFFTTKGAGRGTGLGLAIVREAVQSCGGDIVVESAPGNGTTFTLTLPLRDAHELEATPVTRLRPSTGGVVLFVDDDDALRRTVATLLQEAGLRVLTASGQREALERLPGLQRDTPRFVLITDVVLADGDGLSLIHEARRVRANQPAVLTSTCDVTDEHAVALAKPFTASHLLDAVARALAPP